MDFTHHSNAEISDFLKVNAGSRVCGRVRSDQLVKKTIAPSRPAKRYRLFFAALYFVFGGLLFTSCNSNNDNEDIVGKMQVMEDTIPKTDTTKKILETKPAFDSAKYLDSVKQAKLKKKKQSTSCVPNTDEPEKVMGIMVRPFPPDTTK